MRQIVLTLAFSAVFGATLGCTDGTTPATTTHGTGADGGGGSGAGGGGGSTGTTSAGGAGGSEPGTTMLTAKAGPLTVLPGDEAVKCVIVGLGNSESVFVRRFRTTLHEGSHHMIIYTTDEAPNGNPVPCMSFGVAGGSAIFIAQQAESSLTFPKDENGGPVGLELKANQSLTMEIHYINSTSEPLEVSGEVQLDVLPATSAIVKSGFNFQGAFSIPEIPAQGEADTGVRFQDGIPGTKVFALTTHQHHLGTRMQVWHADNEQDLSKPIADSQSWSDPPLELFEPPLDFPANAAKGFAYQCHWKNPTPETVFGGLGANDEMCFFWSYFYPTGE